MYIQFAQGYGWNNIPPVKVIKAVNTEDVINRLAGIVLELAMAAEESRSTTQEYKALGKHPFCDMNVNAAMLINDICNILQLDLSERVEIFGNFYPAGTND
jgi:hypothetical protein